MKKLIIILLLPLHLFAQSKIKKHILPGSLTFLSGVCDGVADGLQFHYYKNNQFWNPSISWTNKYKNHDYFQGEKFWGSTTVFVFLTDGWHLMKFGRNLFATGAITLKVLEKKKKLINYIIEGISYWILNRIGFAFSYSLFKVKINK